MRLQCAYRPALALFVLVAGSVLVRIWLNRGFQGPQLLCDEYIYAGVARRFATTGDLGFGGGPTVGGSLLYPALIAPAWLSHTMSTVFDLVKVINVTLMSLTAIPVYLWTRRVVSPWWGILAAALVLSLPALALSGMVMSENAALPAFTLGLFAIGVTVEEPTLSRQALVVLTLLVAYEVRAQGLVLLAVLPTAVLLNVVFALRAGTPRVDAFARLRRFGPLGAVVAIGFVAYLARSGFSLAAAVGPYHRIATTHYHPLHVLLWTSRHAGEAVLALGFAPFCALLLLFFMALRRGLRDSAERAFVATASAGVFWFLLQAGIYASAFNPGILERYSMYAFPPLLIAFVIWLGEGLPRPPAETLAAVLFSLALAGTIIFGGFLRPENPSPVFARLTLYFFTRISEHVPGGLTTARLLVLALAAVAAVVFVAATASWARLALLAGTGLLLVLASHSAYGNLAASTGSWRNATGPVRSWIDERIGTSSGSAGYLYVPNPSLWTSSTVLVNTQFWNRSIGPVYTLGSPQLCPLPLETLHLDARTGELVGGGDSESTRERYLVTDRGLAIAGKVVASGGSPAQALTIYRAALPLQLASRLVGVYSDGWTGPKAAYFQYWSPRRKAGRVEVSLSRVAWTGPDVPGTVTVTVERLGKRLPSPPIARRRWLAHKGESTTLRLATPPPPFRISVRVTPTFSPAEFGSSDTRRLGVVFSVAYQPAQA